MYSGQWFAIVHDTIQSFSIAYNRAIYLSIVQDDAYMTKVKRQIAGEYAWTDENGMHVGDEGPFTLATYME